MDFIFKALIKDYKSTEKKEVRDRYGKVAGIVGIISNCILCAMKMLVGTLSGSIAIVADAVNNLADASSSLITLIGFKLAALPEDKDHPYGHARYEYIAGMIVSMLIILVGFELGKSSIEKIIHPEPLEFSWVVVIVLLLAIAIKIWQALFNVSAGKKINSIALIATGADSRNDVISTSAVLVATLIGHFFKVQIDGYVGVVVALFIIWSGISLTKETISPILGEAPDPELVKGIAETVESFPGVLGIHDLIVHDYGPGKIFASVHVEVDSKTDIMESHDLIDTIEFELKKRFGLLVTAHMDPIDMENPLREPIQDILVETIVGLDGVLSFHDLRFVPGPTHTNIIFDVLISPNCKLSHEEIDAKFYANIKAYNPSFFCVINHDLAYADINAK